MSTKFQVVLAAMLPLLVVVAAELDGHDTDREEFDLTDLLSDQPEVQSAVLSTPSPEATKYFASFQGSLHPRHPLVCMDNDAGIRQKGMPGCAAVAAFCEDTTNGLEVRKFCPATCRVPPCLSKATATPRRRAGPCTSAAVAIMISGQLQRFVYQDQTGPLLAPDPKAACPVAVDVYIALSNASLTKAWSGRVTDIPYLSSATPDAIKHWYLARGARRVVVKFVDEDELVRAEATVRQLIRNAPDGKRLDTFVKQGYDKDHWFANFRQYYMRHMVYKLTLDRTYGVLTFWRDDNVFLTPLDLGPMWPKLLASTNAVFVNQYCGFGALSDKIYAFNRGSVDLFFCPTFQAFSKKMLAWVESAVLRGGTNWLQSEAWLAHSLSQDRTQVIKWDFHRTDMRYVDGEFCASPGYRQCTPELATRTEIKVCTVKDEEAVELLQRHRHMLD